MEQTHFYVNTWQRISSCVEPELLESVLSECQAIVQYHERGVRFVEDRFAPYKLTAIYRQYLETSLTKSDFAWNDERELYGHELVARASLLSDGSPDESVPVISVRPETLIYVPERGQIMTNVGAKYEVKFGIQLNFAKTGTYDFKTVIETSPMPNGELFASLRKAIMAKTKPCKFRSPSGIHRSSIRISDGIHERLKPHPMLAAHQLEVL
jgi:hypothetical protein